MAESQNGSWERDLPPGSVRAYDEALKVLAEERARLLKASREASKAGDASEAARMELAAIVNDPGIRAKMENNTLNLADRSERTIAEQSFRRGGRLGAVVERAHQFMIVPDVFGEIEPTVDLDIVFPAENGGQSYELGTTVSVHRTVSVPRFAVRVFHDEPRLYSLVIVDPGEANGTEH